MGWALHPEVHQYFSVVHVVMFNVSYILPLIISLKEVSWNFLETIWTHSWITEKQIRT